MMARYKDEEGNELLTDPKFLEDLNARLEGEPLNRITPDSPAGLYIMGRMKQAVLSGEDPMLAMSDIVRIGVYFGLTGDVGVTVVDGD